MGTIINLLYLNDCDWTEENPVRDTEEEIKFSMLYIKLHSTISIIIRSPTLQSQPAEMIPSL